MSHTSTPAHEEAGHPHVVVLEHEDSAAELLRARQLEDVLDHLLPGPIGRVRLPGDDDLHRLVGVREDARHAVLVAEEQVRSLVGGEAPREADDQRVRVEAGAEPAEHVG